MSEKHLLAPARRWAIRLVVGGFACVGFVVAALALWLWVSAKPVLEAARAQYAALPDGQQCNNSWAPPNYPMSVREVVRFNDAEYAVYFAVCADVGGTCVYMTGAPRWFGFRAYRRLYLSDCAVRALNLRSSTGLHWALRELYPERDPASLNEVEQTCVAKYVRWGRSPLCRRSPECCSVLTH